MKTYEVTRDPGGLKQKTCGLRSHTSKCPVTNEWHPARDDYQKGVSYAEDIKADLVNEIIKTFGTLSPENKQRISD